MKSEICIMGIWDTHYPYHQPEVIDLFLQVAKDYKPQILIMGGDGLDCTSVSSHGASAKVRVEQPIDMDFKGFDKDILSKLDNLKARTKIFFQGNHEKWLEDRTASNPELGKLLDLDTQLNLTKRGWQLIPYKKFWIAPGGKLVFHHGDFRASRTRGGLTKYHASDAVNRIHKNVRYGHAHTAMLFTIANQLKPNHPHSGVSLPCACKMDLPYLENSATNWCQGFYIGWIRTDGSFSDYILIVINGKVSFGGKTYVSRCKPKKI